MQRILRCLGRAGILGYSYQWISICTQGPTLEFKMYCSNFAVRHAAQEVRDEPYQILVSLAKEIWPGGLTKSIMAQLDMAALTHLTSSWALHHGWPNMGILTWWSPLVVLSSHWSANALLLPLHPRGFTKGYCQTCHETTIQENRLSTPTDWREKNFY